MLKLESLLLAAGAGAVLSGTPAAQDLVIPSGITLITPGGTLVVDSLTIEAGATLAVKGNNPLNVVAHDRIVIDGTLDASGDSAPDVATLNTGNIPEFGADGAGGGGAGGTASYNTSASTAQGFDGQGPSYMPLAVVGGRGGESGYGTGSKNNRRPGGGAGGTLAIGDPTQAWPGIVGQVPENGQDGYPTALGAVSGQSPPKGGVAAPMIFLDGNTANDFWGKLFDRTTGQIVVGEAQFPTAGFGGGAGGDAVPSTVFPHPNWGPGTDEKGGPGGGGGGLVKLETSLFILGRAGRVLTNGGGGATGESTIGTDRVGGGGGGGSGGWLILSARRFDLRDASTFAIQAIGGHGAKGMSGFGSINAGGDGGPGVIQFHTPKGLKESILLPPGAQLDDLTAPNAYVLLPLQ